jgi:hypothetical protein
VEVEVEIHPQADDVCSPESKKFTADTEATQTQPEDDSKKATDSQETEESTSMDIGQKETEIAATKEGTFSIMSPIAIYFSVVMR